MDEELKAIGVRIKEMRTERNITQKEFKYVTYSCFFAGLVLFIINRLQLWKDIYGLEFFIFLYYVMYVFDQFFIQLTKGLERVSDMAIAGVIGTISMIATNLLFLLVFRLGLQGFFIANIISLAVPVTYFTIRLKAWNYISFQKTEKKLLSSMLVYCVPLIATVLGWWVNSTFDKYVVAFMRGVAANGVLSVSYKIPQIINTLQGIFIQAWQISAIKEYGSKETAKFYGDTFLTINLLMCIACSLLILLTKPLALILYSKDFYQAWRYVPFLLISSVFNCASGLLGPILSAKKDSKSMMWSALIGACANIILNIALVHFIGIQGATVATVICSFIIYYIRKRAVGDDIQIKGYCGVLTTWIVLIVQGLVECYSSYYLIEILFVVAIFFINIKPLRKVVYSSVVMINSFKK